MCVKSLTHPQSFCYCTDEREKKEPPSKRGADPENSENEPTAQSGCAACMHACIHVAASIRLPGTTSVDRPVLNTQTNYYTITTHSHSECNRQTDRQIDRPTRTLDLLAQNLVAVAAAAARDAPPCGGGARRPTHTHDRASKQ